jgi:predicted nucleic acid-binding protein
MDAIVLLEAGGLLVVEVDSDIGLAAGQLHARHYDRRTRPLSLADCVALATAAELEDALATSDPPLAEAARTEQVLVIGLPDSQGRRP